MRIILHKESSTIMLVNDMKKICSLYVDSKSRKEYRCSVVDVQLLEFQYEFTVTCLVFRGISRGNNISKKTNTDKK